MAQGRQHLFQDAITSAVSTRRIPNLNPNLNPDSSSTKMIPLLMRGRDEVARGKGKLDSFMLNSNSTQ